MVGGVNCVVALHCKGYSWNPGMGKDKRMLQDIALVGLVQIIMDHCTILLSVIGLPKSKLEGAQSLPQLVKERGEGQN